MRSARETEERLDGQAQRYEERLTELHSVIAELSRKLERQRSHVIREDEEEDELEENEDVSQDLNYHSGTSFQGQLVMIIVLVLFEITFRAC